LSNSVSTHASTRAPTPPRLFSRRGVFCALLFIACLLLIWPVAEVGVNDDWVYTLTTLDLLRTGHFVFHGWASPMLGWQALLGALFARLFGATFTAVRLSTAPIAVATVLLYRAILRRFGLNPAHATLGTLVLCLGPVFLPLSVSFMTDVPALFAILLCLYLCQLALSAARDSYAVLWLAAAGLSNIALGTVRQIAWLGVLVMVPSCLWLLRRRRYAVQAGAAVWLAAVVCIALMMHWFARQPYTAPEKLIPGALNLHIAAFAAGQLVRAGATVLLLSLPLLCAAIASLWPLGPRALMRMGFALGLLLILLAVFHARGQAHVIEFPWLGNTFGLRGILQDDPLFGSNRPIPVAWQLLLFFSVAVCALASIEAYRAYRHKPAVKRTPVETIASYREISILLLPFLAAYCALLLPRAAFFVLFDRYLLEVLPVLFVYLLRWHQEHVSERIPALSVAAVVLMALLTVADTHDLFATYRAEVRLANELEAAGVPRTGIRGGFAFDATTQVYAWGYVNDARILNPRGAYHPQPEIEPFKRDGVYCGYGIQRLVPAVQARYVIASEPSPCLGRSSFAPQTFRAWLPPLNRELYAGIPLPKPDGSKLLP
jgi:hypothetical protein